MCRITFNIVIISCVSGKREKWPEKKHIVWTVTVSASSHAVYCANPFHSYHNIYTITHKSWLRLSKHAFIFVSFRASFKIAVSARFFVHVLVFLLLLLLVNKRNQYGQWKQPDLLIESKRERLFSTFHTHSSWNSSIEFYQRTVRAETVSDNLQFCLFKTYQRNECGLIIT